MIRRLKYLYFLSFALIYRKSIDPLQNVLHGVDKTSNLCLGKILLREKLGELDNNGLVDCGEYGGIFKLRVV